MYTVLLTHFHIFCAVFHSSFCPFCMFYLIFECIALGGQGNSLVFFLRFLMKKANISCCRCTEISLRSTKLCLLLNLLLFLNDPHNHVSESARAE